MGFVKKSVISFRCLKLMSNNIIFIHFCLVLVVYVKLRGDKTEVYLKRVLMIIAFIVAAYMYASGTSLKAKTGNLIAFYQETSV